jgi:hypothetical protein
MGRKRARQKVLGSADGVIWMHRKGIPMPRRAVAAPTVSKESSELSQNWKSDVSMNQSSLVADFLD